MKQIYTDVIKIFFDELEIINFYKLCSDIQEMMHNPANFKEVERIDSFSKECLPLVKAYRDAFAKSLTSDRSVENADYSILTSEITVSRIVSSFNTLLFLFSGDNEHSLEKLYTRIDYLRWKRVYFDEIQAWLTDELENKIYPD